MLSLPNVKSRCNKFLFKPGHSALEFTPGHIWDLAYFISYHMYFVASTQSNKCTPYSLKLTGLEVLSTDGISVKFTDN